MTTTTCSICGKRPPNRRDKLLPEGFAVGRVKITPVGDGDEYALAIYDGADFAEVARSRDHGAMLRAAATLIKALGDCVLCDRGW